MRAAWAEECPRRGPVAAFPNGDLQAAPPVPDDDRHGTGVPVRHRPGGGEPGRSGRTTRTRPAGRFARTARQPGYAQSRVTVAGCVHR
jgi:hypothetical protein